MNVKIGTEASIFLFWEYLFQIFGILSLQCIHAKLSVFARSWHGVCNIRGWADLFTPASWGAATQSQTGKTSVSQSEPEFLKLLRSPGIDYKESIPPAYVAWRAVTTALFLLGSYSLHRLFKNSSTEQYILSLKGQCHEIFCFWFFSSTSFPQASDYTIRAVLNYFENSRRYSQLKVCHRNQRNRWQMEKTFKQKNFNNIVWTPLGSRVNMYINFCLKVHFKVSAAWYCCHNLPPVSTTLAKMVEKFATGVVDTGGASWLANISANFRKNLKRSK